jgi:hypothetical protein
LFFLNRLQTVATKAKRKVDLQLLGYRSVVVTRDVSASSAVLRQAPPNFLPPLGLRPVIIGGFAHGYRLHKSRFFRRIVAE